MSVANIHIGAGKCGSSLIQHLLKDADAKECIDQECLPHLSSVLMSNTPCFDYDDYNMQVIFNQIRDEIPLKDCVFSCENIIGMHTHRENSYNHSIKILHHLFDKFDKVRLLLYVRRQDDWLEAMYAQDVKRQEKRSFDDYLAEINLDQLHWSEVADAYGADFELTVLPFEKKVLNTGNIENFVYGFFKWLGSDVEIEDLPVINPSLSPGGMKIQMLANHVLPEADAYGLSFWLENNAPKAPGDRFDLMEDRKLVLDKYRDSNAMLFENWMTGFDPSYYLE